MYKGHRYIDADSHVLEPADMWDQYLEPQYRRFAPAHAVGYRGDPPGFFLNIRIGGSVMPTFQMPDLVQLPGLEESYGDYMRRGFGPDCYDTALQRTGMDYMVLYPTIGLYATAVPGLSAEVAAAYRRAYNNWLYDFCKAAGPRLVGVGSIDLRDPVAAAGEARRCVRELGFKAITFNPEPVNDVALHDRFYDPLWKAASELGVPMGVHVAGGTALHQVGMEYFPQWSEGRGLCAFTIGNMIACLSFVSGGILERFPDLKVAFLESGAGWPAFWLERIQAGVQGANRGGKIHGLSKSPIEYFQKQCYISADPDDPGIAQVAAVIGDDNIVTATDFGHMEGKGYIRALDEILALELPADTKRKIMWDNAARLYNLN
ncbi:MAG TPA: amidohydrolase family protein [Candidatus Binataceae bacterium]